MFLSIFDLNSFNLSISLKLNSVTSSAEAVGVGTLMSHTKSQIVKSISWPTPDIVGIGYEKISLAKSSLLKHQRSSIEPPPLEIITTSILLVGLFSLNKIIRLSALIILTCALSPCTIASLNEIWEFGALLFTVETISWNAAVDEDVIIPIWFGE